MASIRYYPLSLIEPNLRSTGDLYLNGEPYVGVYYRLYTGEAFTGQSPYTGPNERLENQPSLRETLTNTNTDIYNQARANNRTALIKTTPAVQPVGQGKLLQIVTHKPAPLDSDYARGFFKRYFIKRIIDKGYITEISQEDWAIVGSTTSDEYIQYETLELVWQLRGPLHDTRVSQYQIKGGVYDTNKRITERKATGFVGLIEYINGDYTKFARIES